MSALCCGLQYTERWRRRVRAEVHQPVALLNLSWRFSGHFQKMWHIIMGMCGRAQPLKISDASLSVFTQSIPKFVFWANGSRSTLSRKCSSRGMLCPPNWFDRKWVQQCWTLFVKRLDTGESIHLHHDLCSAIKDTGMIWDVFHVFLLCSI